MSEKVYRTAIYCRLSKDDGDKAESNSIVSQRAICEAYIAKHDDLELVETFADDGYSGVSFSRPQFERMEQAIREGRINCVICKDLSRFARNYIEAGRYQERIFPKLGIRFIAVNDGYDTLTANPQSDSFIIPFKNLVNDTYCKDISIKIRSNLDVKRRNGEYVGNFAPYGYMKASDNKNRLVVDEYAGEIVQQIFSMYKDGKSIGRIADRLNEMGVPSPMEYKQSQGVNFDTLFKTGIRALWSYNSVKRILTNELYIGVLVQGKSGTPNYKVRKVRKKEESDWIKVEGAVEPLINYADFSAVKMMLGRDMRSISDGEEENLLSGFLFCADCGQAMVRKTVPSKNKKYVYYVCSTAKHKKGCSSHCISAKEVEEAVLHTIHDQIELVLKLDKALDAIPDTPLSKRHELSYEAQEEKLNDEIGRYQDLKLRLYEDLSAGVIDKEEYGEFRNRYNGMISERRTALERIKRERHNMAVTGISDRQWVKLFKEYENIEDLNRRAMMALVDKILIHEDHGIEICFQYAAEFACASEYMSELAADKAEAI